MAHYVFMNIGIARIMQKHILEQNYPLIETMLFVFQSRLNTAICYSALFFCFVLLTVPVALREAASEFLFCLKDTLLLELCKEELNVIIILRIGFLTEFSYDSF
jgi:hypothetical protein